LIHTQADGLSKAQPKRYLNTDDTLKEAFLKKPFITWKLIQM
jgi:hypothetical protein